VPNVIGLTAAEAAAQLGAQGLTIRRVEVSGTPPTPDVAWRTYYQSPPAGAAIPADRAVVLKQYGSGKVAAAPPQPSQAGAAEGDPWFQTGERYHDFVGHHVAVRCQPGGPIGPLAGTDVYTDDSSICTAAVHAGRIRYDVGGMVVVVIQPGREAFTGSSRHDLTSASRGPRPRSFAFVVP
jgi:hypothetical protein